VLGLAWGFVNERGRRADQFIHSSTAVEDAHTARAAATARAEKAEAAGWLRSAYQARGAGYAGNLAEVSAVVITQNEHH